MDNELFCNFKKCRKELNTQGWVTACSHLFCNEHGAKEFGRRLACPACDTPLPGKYDAILVDLNPPEEYKSMVLAGQRPDVILDISARAINFWTYQVHQEITYKKYMIDKANERQIQLEKYYENVIQKTKTESEQIETQMQVTKKQLEAAQKRVAELTEKLNQRTRQFQKLQALHESLRRKFISPSFFEKRTVDGKSTEHVNTIGITSINDVISPNRSRSNIHDGGYETEREFILRPMSEAPLNSSRIRRDTFAFLNAVETNHAQNHRLG